MPSSAMSGIKYPRDRLTGRIGQAQSHQPLSGGSGHVPGFGASASVKSHIVGYEHFVGGTLVCVLYQIEGGAVPVFLGLPGLSQGQYTENTCAE